MAQRVWCLYRDGFKTGQASSRFQALHMLETHLTRMLSKKVFEDINEPSYIRMSSFSYQTSPIITCEARFEEVSE